MLLGKRKTTSSEYYAAKKAVTNRIVMRLARGNVKAQNGHASSLSKLKSHSRAADEFLSRAKFLVENAA